MNKRPWIIGSAVVLWCVYSFGAQADFGDREQGAHNTVQAGTVDIVLTDDVSMQGVDVSVGDQVSGAVRIVNEGSLDTRYSVAVVQKNGQTTCDALTLQMRRDGNDVYTGILAGAEVDGQLLAGGATTAWDFAVTAAHVVGGAACEFGFVVHAVQADSGAHGFFDIEETQQSSVSIREAVVALAAPVGTGWTDAQGQSLTCAAADTWTNTSAVTFEWQAVNGAQDYEYEIVSPQSSVHSAVTTNTHAATTDVATEGMWTFRVRAQASGTSSSWSQTCTLHVDHTAPLPTSPVVVDFVMPPQTQYTANGVTFKWTTNESAVAAVYFDKNPSNYFDFTTYAYHAPLVPTDSFVLEQNVVTAFPTPGTYFYLVVITDRAGNVTVSPPGVFNVPSLPAIDVISLNEIVANPVGNDDASMPSGEWVELYNRGALAVDVAGWRITDAVGRSWTISAANSDVDGDTTDGGETEIAPGGYLVVYRNGASMALNNTGGEEIFLYDAYGALMDQHSFTLDGMPEGKSVARFPDGVGVWIDPDGTPGDKNMLSERERDALRAQVFVQCFHETKTLVMHDAGSLCDPIFVAYIGMIKDEKHVGLALPEFFDKKDAVSQEEDAVPVEETVTQTVGVAEDGGDSAAKEENVDVVVEEIEENPSDETLPDETVPSDMLEDDGKLEDDPVAALLSDEKDDTADDDESDVAHNAVTDDDFTKEEEVVTETIEQEEENGENDAVQEEGGVVSEREEALVEDEVESAEDAVKGAVQGEVVVEEKSTEEPDVKEVAKEEVVTVEKKEEKSEDIEEKREEEPEEELEDGTEDVVDDVIAPI